jgi:type I site-specific restriction-modification system R (restriction) subunit
MKKLITLLLVSSLYFSWATAQEKPSIGKPKFGEHLSPDRPKFVKKDFPRHWGKPPEIQLRDYVDLPKGFGKGSSTLAYWIKENLKEDSIEKPEILTDREKLDPRKYEAEVMGKVKEGSITRDEAQKKLGALREEMEKKGEFKRPKRPQKPELSDSVKESISNIKSQQEALHRSMKTKLADLGKDASKEDMRDAIETFKTENKEKFDAIKEANEAIRESIEASRPAKPERPELTAELKVKVEALKEKEKALHTARKELNSQLKEASKEEKKTLISEFKENNKVKHEEIKTKSKEIKEEIRALVETEATRTSDL